AAIQELRAQDIAEDRIRLECKLYLRYEGTDTALPVPLDTPEAMLEAFQTAYMQRFSFLMPDRPLVIDSAVVEAIGNEPVDAGADDSPGDTPDESIPDAADTVSMYCDGQWRECPLYEGSTLKPGHLVQGPAV